ncbi:tetratricopeptide repeat protein [Dysgonomonas sp.]
MMTDNPFKKNVKSLFMEINIKNIHFPFFLLFLLLLSCSDNRTGRLLRLTEDELAVYKPSDSSLIYLEMIDYPEKLPEKDFAKYILLLTEAHYRHKVTIENDTLITAAIRYYKRNNDVRSLSLSYLYAGRIWEVRGNTEGAAKYFSEAFELSTSSGDYKQAGKSAYGLGELYMDKTDYRESMKWLNLALSNFRESGSLFHEINTVKRLGDCFVLNNQLDSALILFEKALSITPKDKKALRSDIYKDMAVSYFKAGEYDTAISSIKKSIAILPEEKQYSLQYLILADTYQQNKQLDSALLYNKKAITYAKDAEDYNSLSQAYSSLVRIGEIETDYLKALENYRLHKTASDSVYQKQTYEAAATLTKLYNKERLLVKNKELIIRNQRYMFFLIVSLALVLLIVSSGFKILKRRRQDIIDKENAIRSMELVIKNNEKTIMTYKISSEEILKGYMRMVQLSISPQKDRYKNFLLEYNKVMYDSDAEFRFNWNIFCGLLTNAHNRYIEKLRYRFKKLTDREIQAIAMQKAGFEISDIAGIFGYSINTVYKRNSDIRKKLKIPELGNIIEFIDQKLTEAGSI